MSIIDDEEHARIIRQRIKRPSAIVIRYNNRSNCIDNMYNAVIMAKKHRQYVVVINQMGSEMLRVIWSGNSYSVLLRNRYVRAILYRCYK